MRHKSALPPMEAYLYFPTDEKQIVLNERNPDKNLRLIFSGVSYVSSELKKIEQLHQRIREINSKEKESIIFPDWWEESDSLRFLQAKDGNIEKTIDIIKKQIEWRNTTFPFTINERIIEILNSGF